MQITLPWLLHEDVCSLGRRSSFVICKAMIADRSGTAGEGDVWMLGIALNALYFLAQSGSRRRWGNLGCATGAACARARPPL